MAAFSWLLVIWHEELIALKIVQIDREERKLILEADFWEMEIKGYDVKNEKAVVSHFFEDLSEEIDFIVKKVFDNDYEYAIHSMVDYRKGRYLYEILPYDEGFNAFITTTMQQAGLKCKVYKGRAWIISD